MSRYPFISLILSGGQSQRMGQDKATLQIGEQSLINRQVQLLESLNMPVWVSGYYPQYHYVEDDSDAKGPLAGIGSAMRTLESQAKALLVIAVDMPLLTISALSEFLALVTEQEQCWFTDQSRFPIWLPINSQTLQHTKACEQSGNFALKPWLSQLQARSVTCSHIQQLTNTNTPEQWQQAIAYLDGEERHESQR
ncbi:molybdenum cofactor guanylyltransferase [Celerinatantimonas sp. MCCC 1A17872]|uniref:molybdenum cofactor guanylyltransferase n=1 Tax=Celerinatantimonas sp. MCCC 1A17872 TaxID=3177514 RepID=UPI0038C661FD